MPVFLILIILTKFCPLMNKSLLIFWIFSLHQDSGWGNNFKSHKIIGEQEGEFHLQVHLLIPYSIWSKKTEPIFKLLSEELIFGSFSKKDFDFNNYLCWIHSQDLAARNSLLCDKVNKCILWDTLIGSCNFSLWFNECSNETTTFFFPIIYDMSCS